MYLMDQEHEHMMAQGFFLSFFFFGAKFLK